MRTPFRALAGRPAGAYSRAMSAAEEPQTLPALVTAERVRRALDVLERIAGDELAPTAPRVSAARAILAAGITIAGRPPVVPRSAEDLTIGELEAAIAAARRRLGIVGEG